MVRMSLLPRTKRAQEFSSKPPPHTLSRKKIELKVPLCCEVCEENVRGQLTLLEGVQNIEINLSSQKVVVFGHRDVKLETAVVLNAVKKVKNRAEIWKPSRDDEQISCKFPI